MTTKLPSATKLSGNAADLHMRGTPFESRP